MSTSVFHSFIGSLLGITAFYLLESLYYDIKSRWRGRQYTKFLEDLEEDSWDD